MKSNRLVSFLCWTAIVVVIFVIQIIYVIVTSDGVVMRRDLTEATGRALAWSLFPLAIWGSIIKAKSKRESSDTPLAPTPRLLAKASPTPLPAPQKQPPLARPIVQNNQIVREPQLTPPIMKPVPVETPAAAPPVMDNEAFYEQVAEEIATDTMKPGIWARAFAETDGENDRAKALYIRLRVAQLVNARDVELQEAQRLKAQQALEEKQARDEAAELKRQEQAEVSRKLQEMEAQRAIAEEQAKQEAAEQEGAELEMHNTMLMKSGLSPQAGEQDQQHREAEEKQRQASAKRKSQQLAKEGKWEPKESRSDTEKFITYFFLTLVVIVILFGIYQTIAP